MGFMKRLTRQRETPNARSGNLGITDPSQVDLVALAPGGDAVQIVIVLDSGWTDADEGFDLLQHKIDNSVAFAADGELANLYPHVAQLPWEIVVSCRVDPGDRTTAYLTTIGLAIANYGGTLRLQLPGTPWPSAGDLPGG